jgi:hypothetical protein
MTTIEGGSPWDEEDDDGDVDIDDLLLPAEHTSPKMHDGLPITGYNRGEPIPDLGRIPQERWREVLRPLGRYTRQLTRSTVATQEEVRAVGILIGDLLTEDRPVGMLPPPPKVPGAADPPLRSPRRQVSFRLGPEEHARLLQAARTYGMRPAVLARLLTVRGVDRALRDARRDA